jgi:hypothetical protein
VLLITLGFLLQNQVEHTSHQVHHIRKAALSSSLLSFFQAEITLSGWPGSFLSFISYHIALNIRNENWVRSMEVLVMKTRSLAPSEDLLKGNHGRSRVTGSIQLVPDFNIIIFTTFYDALGSFTLVDLLFSCVCCGARTETDGCSFFVVTISRKIYPASHEAGLKLRPTD